MIEVCNAGTLPIETARILDRKHNTGDTKLVTRRIGDRLSCRILNLVRVNQPQSTKKD